jgi:pimeloyl-ACP methyl ester carboxylesterase
VHDYTHLAEDVEDFIDIHKLKRPTLIGHSMGAKTAMCVALKSPEKVANLIPVDNAPVDAALKTDFGTFVRGMRVVEERKVKNLKEADEVLKEYATVGIAPVLVWFRAVGAKFPRLQLTADTQDTTVRLFLLTNLTRSPSNDHLVWRIPLTILAQHLDDMGDFPYRNPDEFRYNGPTLIVRGTRSHYVADETLPIIGRFFPRFELADIDAGHWVISENPEEFRRVVVEFLSDKE